MWILLLWLSALVNTWFVPGYSLGFILGTIGFLVAASFWGWIIEQLGGTGETVTYVTKSCTSCGRSVSNESRAGQRCPHCGAYWSEEFEKNANEPVPQALKEIGCGLLLLFIVFVCYFWFAEAKKEVDKVKEYYNIAEEALLVAERADASRVNPISFAEGQTRMAAGRKLWSSIDERKESFGQAAAFFQEAGYPYLEVLAAQKIAEDTLAQASRASWKTKLTLYSRLLTEGKALMVEGADATVPLEKRTDAYQRATAKFNSAMQVIAWEKIGGMEMVHIPSGTFRRGSGEVRITKPFLLGKYPVTQAQYEVVMGTNPSNFEGPNRPVEEVSWDDAVAFCRKLTELERTLGRLGEGEEYRLPTEAEWEYACRAGTTTKYYWGDNFDGDYAWYSGNSNGSTQDVGQKKPNAWGLYDMSGNVWEWCSDWYGDYMAGPVSDPTGPSTGPSRVLRGGSWSSDYEGPFQCAYRHLNVPTRRNRTLGFRCARTFAL